MPASTWRAAIGMYWYQTPEVTRWAWQAWRYYSWRPNYHLQLNPRERTAYVDMQRHLVVCNPTYPYPPARLGPQVRHLPADEHAFQMKYLEGLIAHEAGHTHFSGELPQGLLGQLVNIIEDQRMEWLMRNDFPNLRELFEMAADADAAHAIHSAGLGGDLLRGCLLHRWVHDHPNWRYQPPAQQQDLWDEVKGLLEGAWLAEHYSQVIDAARQILDLLKLPEQQAARPDLQLMLDGSGQLLLNKRPGTARPGQQGRGPEQTGGPDSQQASSAGGGKEGDQPSEDAQVYLLEPAVPQAQATTVDGDEDSQPFEAPGHVQSPDAPEALPTQPEIEPAATAETARLHTITAGEARKLAHILRPAGRPAQRTHHRERGKYRYDRDLQGLDRTFERKEHEHHPGQVHLRLAVDISYSMEQDSRITVAREVCYTLAYAAQLAGIPMLAYAFDHRSIQLFHPRSTPTAALNAAASLQACGDTLLSPTLKSLWSAPLPGLSITLILSDGELTEADYQACGKLKDQQRHGVIVPILLGTKESTRANYQRTFGNAVLLSQASELSAHISAYLRARIRTA